MTFFRSIRRALATTALALAAAAPAQAADTAFSGAAVAGCSYASQTYTCSALPLPNYNDSISIASGYTVVVTAPVYIGYNQGLTMSGSAALQSNGDLNIGDINPSNLAVSGGSLSSGGTFTICAQAQTITANVTAATLNIGTGSTTKITGSLTATGTVNLGSHVTIVGPVSGATVNTTSPVSLTGDVTASSAFTLASGSSLVGNVTAPTVTLSPSSVTVKGNIAASTSLSIGSGNTVTGNVSGGGLTLAPSSASIKGNVNLTGDVDIGSGDNITGNLVGHNVTTESSNGYISGNASVNSLTLNYGGYVGGTVTCTAPGATGCSCVNYTNSGRAAPTCSAAAAAGPDHILITQNGSGLTCQPSTVTLTACADAACSTPYNSSVSVVFTAHSVQGQQTVNQNYTFTGSTTASVQQTTADTVNLSTNTAYACKDTGSPSTPSSCAMAFSDTGLLIASPSSPTNTVNNFVSATTAANTITISALKTTSSGTSAASCQPLFNGVQTVKLSYAYINPTSGTLPAIVNNTPLAANSSSACSSGGANVSLSFNSNGVASASLNYSDVGQLTLSATYTGSGNYSGLTATGTSNAFTVAPASLQLTVPNMPAPTPGNPNPLFLKAGQSFSVALSALNSAGAVTLNYGKETTPQSFSLSSPKLVLPSAVDSNGNSTGDNPYRSAPPSPTWTMANGVFTSSPITWNEVGTFELDAALSNPGGYLGNGQFATGSANVGRFSPDHFETVVVTSTNWPMPCSITSPAYSIAGCPSSNQAVYSNQPFAVQVTAKGPPDHTGTSKTLTNYDKSQLAKAITFSGWMHAGSTLAQEQNPPAVSSQMPDGIAASQFSGGVATASAQVPQTIRYVFATPTGSNFPPAPTVVYLRAIDPDLTTSRAPAAPNRPCWCSA